MNNIAIQGERLRDMNVQEIDYLIIRLPIRVYLHLPANLGTLVQKCVFVIGLA